MRRAPGDSAHSSTSLIAPLWHTLLLTAAVLAVSVLGLRIKAHASALATHHVREYLLTLGWEWALAGAVLWGVAMRGVPWRALLGEWTRGSRAWLRDAVVALGFWVVSACVLGAVGILLNLIHLKLPAKTVAALAPSDLVQLLLFLALSLSAGFCEELLFRGYFQQQFTRLSGGLAWVGAAASSLLFGCAHLYEGAAGVIAITLFGAMFSLLARNRRSLRPGMLAHAWHDAVSGLVLFLLQRTHTLS